MVFPTRWTYAAAAGTVNLNRFTPSVNPDRLWDHDASTWLGCLLLTSVLMAVFTAVSAQGVRRRFQ